MHIIEVIPLTLLPQNVPQILSYFSTEPLPKGAVVEILIRNRKINAVVIETTSVEQQKQMLRKSDFQLKKITKIISATSRVSDIQFRLALWLSKFYYAPLGMCLKTVLPPFFLAKGYTAPSDSQPTVESPRPLVIQSRAKNTIRNIEHYISTGIRDKGQVLIILPEDSVISYFFENIRHLGNTVLYHGALKKKELQETWGKIESGKAQIIIGTRQAILAPYKNLKLVIVEDPANEAYKSDMTPKYNAPAFAYYLAQLHGAECMFVSSIPDIESYYQIEKEIFHTRDNTSSPTADVKLINAMDEVKTDNFNILSRSLAEHIKSYVYKKKKILLLSSRKGYSGILVCQNCGLTAKCPNCSIPMRVHKIPEPTLLCYHCGHSRKIPSFCPNCNSNNIKAIGMPGSQKIYDQLERLFRDSDDQPVIKILDNDTAKTAKEEKEILHDVSKGPSILISTQMIFAHRYEEKFDLVALPTADGLITMPDFRAEERLFYQMEKIYDLKPEFIIIQSYYPQNEIFQHLADNRWREFFEKELSVRKMFNYPPYWRLAKLTFKSKDSRKGFTASRITAEKLRMVISQLQLKDDVELLGPSPAFIEREKGLYAYHLILKLKPDFKHEKILKYVPPYWLVELDPKNII